MLLTFLSPVHVSSRPCSLLPAPCTLPAQLLAADFCLAGAWCCVEAWGGAQLEAQGQLILAGNTPSRAS